MLPTPLHAEKWRRLAFLYTPGEWLLDTRKLNVQSADDEERVLLWKAPKERINKRGSYSLDENIEDLVIPELFPYLAGLSKKK